jgi:tRNA (guanine37-N1)-methyltransferase
MFNALDYGIVGRALNQEAIKLNCINPRDFSLDKHQTVDDKPYGGGPGMVMKYEPLAAAITAAKTLQAENTRTIYLSPQGHRLDQSYIHKLTSHSHIVLIAGRYEGIDERIIQTHVDDECSIGDYVLSGGELAAMVLIDGITRLLPGTLGDEQSAKQDSFVDDLLDYPHYTRPEIVANQKVPEVLLSGDHAAIARWRLKQSLGRTWLRRPDLLEKKFLTTEQQILLNEFIEEMVEK